mgnify:CR=1 FL=1
MNNRSVLGVVSIVASSAASAASIGLEDLPNEIQSCVSTQDCFVVMGSTFDHGGTSAFYFNDSGTDKWLMRYTLFAPSGENGNAAHGYVWMSANQQYSAGESFHGVTLYTDAVSPTPTDLWIGRSNDSALSFGVTTADLVAGSGFVVSGLDANNTPYAAGNLQTYGDFGASGLISCVAEGCQASAQLNLVNLHYTQYESGELNAVFNVGDTRALLYTQSFSFDGSYLGSESSHTTQEYFVQPVPIPAGIVLLASGLMGLWRFTRRGATRLS